MLQEQDEEDEEEEDEVAEPVDERPPEQDPGRPGGGCGRSHETPTVLGPAWTFGAPRNGAFIGGTTVR
jgi:hypothetical protein